MKHLIWITPGFPKDEADSICIPPLQSLARQLKVNYPEYKLRVLSLHYPYRPKNYEWEGIEVIALGGNNRKFPRRLLLWRKALATLRKMHRQQPADLIHSFWLSEPAWLAQRFSDRARIPHVCTIMGQDARKDNRYLNRLKLERITKVGLSDYQLEQFQQSGNQTDHQIPWGQDFDQMPELPVDNKDIDVLGLGALTSLKNYRLWIDTIEKLRQNMPQIKAVLVGGGPEFLSLEKLVRTRGLEKNIQLIGQQTREVALDHMARSKVLLHTSSFESFGYVFSEALFYCAAIVSFRVGAAQPGKQWFIADKEEELVSLTQQALAQHEDNQVLRFHDMRDTTRQYSELYSAVL